MIMVFHKIILISIFCMFCAMFARVTDANSEIKSHLKDQTIKETAKNLSHVKKDLNNKNDKQIERSILQTNKIASLNSTPTESPGSKEDLQKKTATMRLTRSASQDQWDKEKYPAHKINHEDTEGSHNMRAPNVHFVTQKRNENDEGFKIGSHNRAAKQDRNFPRESNRDFLGDRSFPEYRYKNDYPEQESQKVFARERNYNRRRSYDRFDEPYRNPRSRFFDIPSRYERNFYPPRRSFNYYPAEDDLFDSPPSSSPRRQRFGRRYERFRQYDFERGNLDKPKKQTRIIYYATLPEVARSPPKVNLRDRFNYKYDNFMDDPYYFGPGRFKESYSPPPHFYENKPKRAKPAPSETKFSKDINVKEPKKIPESRIYSEVDRHYEDEYEPYSRKNK